MRSIWRSHQIDRRRSGIGGALAANEKVWVSPPAWRLCQYTATATARNTRKSMSPGWSR